MGGFVWAVLYGRFLVVILYGRFWVVSYTNAVAHTIVSLVEDCRVQIAAPLKPYAASSYGAHLSMTQPSESSLSAFGLVPVPQHGRRSHKQSLR